MTSVEKLPLRGGGRLYLTPSGFLESQQKHVPINEITIKNARIGFRWVAIDLEYVEKIIELAMDITKNGNLAVVREVEIHERGFCLEQFFGFHQHLENVPKQSK